MLPISKWPDRAITRHDQLLKLLNIIIVCILLEIGQAGVSQMQNNFNALVTNTTRNPNGQYRLVGAQARSLVEMMGQHISL